MRIRDYKKGDVPDYVCLHKTHWLKFGYRDEDGVFQGYNTKCTLCDKFSQKEIEAIKIDMPHFTEDFINNLRLTK